MNKETKKKVKLIVRTFLAANKGKSYTSKQICDFINENNLGRYFGALRRLRTFTTPIIVVKEVQAFDEMLLQAIKCLDGKSKFYSNVTRPVPSQDPIDVLLTSVKGISSKKAESIRKTHNLSNIYDLMNLTINNFEEVEGIGSKTSSNIYEFIHKGEEE